jgi:hypothetical protein
VCAEAGAADYDDEDAWDDYRASQRRKVLTMMILPGVW